MYRPCKDCTDRYVGCHGGCDRYAKYRALLSKATKMNEAEVVLIEHKYAYKTKRMKKRG